MMSEFGSFGEFMEDDDIREVISMPRNIPRRNREEIAEIFYREVILGEDYEIKDAVRFIEKYGVFYLIFVSLKGSDEWAWLKATARNSRISSLVMLRIVLTNIFNLLDEFGLVVPDLEKGLPDSLALPLEQFAALLEYTLELWHRRVSGDPSSTTMGLEPELINPELFPASVIKFQEGEASGQFLSLLSRKALLDDILARIGEVEDHLPSLELLSLLYPGRSWDHSMLELHRTYFASLHKYARIVERNEDIKKVLSLIGRTEIEHGARSRSMAGYSKSEVHSVTISGDLQHMLPVESVKLQDETLKNLFFARWMDGKLLTYQLMGRGWAAGAKKKRGPMVAMVDTSGSMLGAPEILAKSIVLALVRHMLMEGRDIKVFLFSSTGQTTGIEMTDSKKMASEFLDFLSYTFEGGTDFNTAIEESLETLAERQYRNADILFITDGLSMVSDQRVIDGLNDVKKKNGTRLSTIIIGNDDAGGMDKFSDRVFILGRSDDRDPGNSPVNAIKLISMR